MTVPVEPNGKRVIFQNHFGIWLGFIRNRRFWNFMTNEEAAKRWAAGASLRSIYDITNTNTQDQTNERTEDRARVL
jgi:hypothetical protein